MIHRVSLNSPQIGPPGLEQIIVLEIGDTASQALVTRAEPIESRRDGLEHIATADERIIPASPVVADCLPDHVQLSD